MVERNAWDLSASKIFVSRKDNLTVEFVLVSSTACQLNTLYLLSRQEDLQKEEKGIV
jgi:hypothetical protein